MGNVKSGNFCHVLELKRLWRAGRGIHIQQSYIGKGERSLPNGSNELQREKSRLRKEDGFVCVCAHVYMHAGNVKAFLIWENLEWREAIEIVYRKTLNKTTLKRTKLSNCLAKYFRYYRNNNHRIVTVYERSPPSIYTIPGSTSWPFCSACILVFWCKSFESLLLRVA